MKVRFSEACLHLDGEMVDWAILIGLGLGLGLGLANHSSSGPQPNHSVEQAVGLNPSLGKRSSRSFRSRRIIALGVGALFSEACLHLDGEYSRGF